ncbi:cysteine hydrolase family protein [Glaciimonas soli]|uniref:Isochorismatase family protein n=1 Tax=Glaciimonas soli TaxID=2590999 RepID=A0A843YSR0_9BURK|nr:cysteine hydrolase family protein [Glaciimonas soli]MQR00613.1 isochorismatase family protein [Glaciimonas soli]
MSHPTIRTIVGAPATTQLDPNTTALIVVDIQNEYFSGMLPIPDGMTVLRQSNRLIALADRHNMAVFHIQHFAPASSPIFAEGSVMAEIHADVLRSPQHSLIKKGGPSSFAGTQLHAQLQARGIKTLIISGLMTNNCIAATTLDGAGLGYQNIVASDASATRDLDAGNGEVLNHKDIHRAILVGLSDAAAEVRTTDDILEFRFASA